MARVLVGVMGPGAGASAGDVAAARELGRLIALEGWALLTGGRASGVMEAASRGAREAGGLTVGLLPGEDASQASEFVEVAIVTGLGQARNNLNVLSSRVVVACGMGAGTAAEVALAVKARRPVVLLRAGRDAEAFFKSLGGGRVSVAPDPASAVNEVRRLLGG